MKSRFVFSGVTFAIIATVSSFAAPPTVGAGALKRPHVIDASRITFNERMTIDPKLLDRKQTISGSIHYPKTYGKLGAGSGKSFAVTVYTLVKHDASKDPAPQPGAIVIAPNDFDEVPVSGVKVYQASNPKPEGDDYVFNFSISDVPYDQEVYVSAQAVKSLPAPAGTAGIDFNTSDKITLTAQNASRTDLVFTPHFTIIH